MKRIVMAIGSGTALFMAGLLWQSSGATKLTITWADKINHVAVSKDRSSHADAMGPLQPDVEPTSYLATAKRLLIFKKILPKHERIMVFYSISGEESPIVDARAAAERLGIDLVERPVRTVAELQAALSRIKSARVDGIFHIPDRLVAAHMDLILEEAKKNNIPTMTYDESYIAEGALIAYGIRPRNRFLQEPPGGMIGSRAPGKRLTIRRTPPYELVINLDTANQIDFRFPQMALNRADRIVGDQAD